MARVGVVTGELAMGGGVLSKLAAFLEYALQRGHPVELVHLVMRRDPGPVLDRLYECKLLAADHAVCVSELMPHAWRYEAFHRGFPSLAGIDAWQVVAAWLPSGLPLARRRLPFLAWVAGPAGAEIRAIPSKGLKHLFLYNSMALAALERQEREVACASSGVLVDSRSARDRLRARVEVPKSALRVLPATVDVERFRPAGDGVRRSVEPYLLCVARLDRIKDLPMLLRAFAALKRRPAGAALELRIVGEGSERRALERLAHELGIAASVRLLGELTGEALVEAYQRAQLYVLTSRYESLGIAALEAMACGLPVIATSCGGPEDTVVAGGTGLFVPIGDHGQLAARIEFLLHDPALRRRMAEAARRRAVEHFSVGRMAAELDAVYGPAPIVAPASSRR